MNDATTNKATVTIQGPRSEAACTRERRWAHGEKGGRVELWVSRQDRGGVKVLWVGDRGKGWGTTFSKTFHGAGAEAKALAYAETKWAFVVAWLERQSPAASVDGASAAFSAQVASLATH